MKFEERLKLFAEFQREQARCQSVMECSKVCDKCKDLAAELYVKQVRQLVDQYKRYLETWKFEVKEKDE